jgi:N-acetylneuraminic acid mutarotase
MPTARGEFGTAVVNGKIYAIGGVNQNNQPLNTVEEYNPLTSQWTSKMAMPTARSGFAIAVYDNKIYVIGGSVGNGFVGNNEVYDPAANTWTTKASMQTPRADLTASIVNGQIYLIGGKMYSNQAPFYTETALNEVYDPIKDQWSTKSPIPSPVEGYASAVLSNRIYVIGGSKVQASTGSAFTNSNQVYNPATDQWSLAASLPVASSYATAVATQGNMAKEAIYYIGGYTGNQYSNHVRIYTPDNNSWSTAEDMPTARAYLSAAVVNDLIYAIGGFNGEWLSINELYTPLDYGTMPPKVVITSPQNRTYQQVTVSFVLNRDASWVGYSLDGGVKVTLTSEVELKDLSQGAHQIRIYANDSAGNMGASDAVFFSIDTIAPEIQIISPANQSYGSTDVQLQFIVDDLNATLAYSLDGQASVTIIGNQTLLALSNGGHRITLYAIDSLGNASEDTVYFEVAPFPWLLLTAVLVTTIIVVAASYIMIKRKKAGAEGSGGDSLSI